MRHFKHLLRHIRKSACQTNWAEQKDYGQRMRSYLICINWNIMKWRDILSFFIFEEDSVLEGEGRRALLAAEAAHRAGDQPPPLLLLQSHKPARGADWQEVSSAPAHCGDWRGEQGGEPPLTLLARSHPPQAQAHFVRLASPGTLAPPPRAAPPLTAAQLAGWATWLAAGFGRDPSDLAGFVPLT